MKAIVQLKSTEGSPLTQSRFHNIPKLEKESAEAYDARTWLEHAHFDDAGEMFIPPMALKFCLDKAAKELGEQVKGRGKKTYAQSFKCGVMCFRPVMLGIKREQVGHIDFLANVDGLRGSGKRVWRRYPQIKSWSGIGEFEIVNAMITPDIFERHLREAGKFVGLGQFRPEVGGYNGRFEVVSIKWEE